VLSKVEVLVTALLIILSALFKFGPLVHLKEYRYELCGYGGWWFLGRQDDGIKDLNLICFELSDIGVKHEIIE